MFLNMVSLFRKRKGKVNIDAFTEHTVAGHRFRVFKDVSVLPFYRAIFFMRLQEFGDWRMSDDAVSYALDKLNDLVKQGRQQEALQLLTYIQQLRSMHAYFSEFMDYVDLFVMIEDEPVKRPHPEFKQIKVELAEQEEIATFFLQSIIGFYRQRETSLKNIKAFLVDRGLRLREKRLLRFILQPVLPSLFKI